MSGFLTLCSLLKFKNLALLRTQPFLFFIILPSSMVNSISSHRHPQKGQATELIVVSFTDHALSIFCPQLEIFNAFV